jgi:RNA polymerase sigma-70 factor, ECF subfamily
LYDELGAVSPSPVVALGRAVAVSMISLDAAWADLESLLDQLDRCPPYWAARADVLRRSGRLADAAAEYRRAATFEVNEPERRFLVGRADECAHQASEDVI